MPAAADARLRPASLKVRALQWLAQREHSPAELREKLLRAARAPRVWRADAPGRAAGDPGSVAADHAPIDPAQAAMDAEAEVDALIAWLNTQGYLSAQRFIDSRVHARQARHGQQRIAHELQRHGLCLDPQAREALQATEFDRAREVWRRKYGTPAADATGRVRQMRFLAGRGFSHEVIRRIVRAAPGDAED